MVDRYNADIKVKRLRVYYMQNDWHALAGIVHNMKGLTFNPEEIYADEEFAINRIKELIVHCDSIRAQSEYYIFADLWQISTWLWVIDREDLNIKDYFIERDKYSWLHYLKWYRKIARVFKVKLKVPLKDVIKWLKPYQLEIKRIV